MKGGNLVLITHSSIVQLAMIIVLGGCTHVSLKDTNHKSQPHRLLTDSVPLDSSPTVSPNQVVSLTGKWRLGFQNGNKNLSSTININQSGANFAGDGIDDQSQRHFLIDEGTINGSQIAFVKIYDDNKLKVAHRGDLSTLNEGDYHGPYMGGEYQTNFQGKPLQGQWEAAMVSNDGIHLSSPQTAQEIQAPSQPPPAQTNKVPDLSGKWNVGFEYNFKTVHSVMYLEQEGNKITGHGVDVDGKEKFVLTKGLYQFPHLTFVRKYNQGTGLGKNATEMTFKGIVSVVHDQDYQGPYLNGKTSGGGLWEAELVK